MATKTDTQVSSFQAETSASLSRLRAALCTLTAAIGQKFDRPTDLRRILGVDAKLSWQIFNVINESDPLAAVKLIPSEASLNRLITAVEKLGANKDLGESIREAMVEFNRVVERHAEDREEFDFMASTVCGSSNAATAELAFRRLAYRAESHIWGVNTSLLGGITIARLSEDRHSTDEISILNKRGARRLRPDVPNTLVAYRNYGFSTPSADNTRIPLDQAAADLYGAHLMPQFCTQPIPKFKTYKRLDGYTAVDLDSCEIGHQSAIDLTLGHICRRCPLAVGLNGEPFYHSSARIWAPTALLLSYLLIHRPSFGRIKPSVEIFRSTNGDDNPAIAASAPKLSVRDEIRFMGVGKHAWSTPYIHRHEEMIQAAFNEIGWNPEEFDVYKFKIEYPALHSVIRMQFPVSAS